MTNVNTSPQLHTTCYYVKVNVNSSRGREKSLGVKMRRGQAKVKQLAWLAPQPPRDFIRVLYQCPKGSPNFPSYLPSQPVKIFLSTPVSKVYMANFFLNLTVCCTYNVPCHAILVRVEIEWRDIQLHFKGKNAVITLVVWLGSNGITK